MQNYTSMRVATRASLCVFLSIVGLTVTAASAQTNAASPYPATAMRPVTDTFKGTGGSRKVVDDYRWLESLSDRAVKDWVEQ